MNAKQLFVLSAVLALEFLGLPQLRAASQDASRLPVVEVTAFKDGHAFIAQEGTVSESTPGEVMLDNTPSPVLGTFWVYTPSNGTKILSVTAGRRIVPINRTALSLRELIDANPGAAAVVTETNQTSYNATVIGFLTRTTKELTQTSPPNTDEQLPRKSDLVMLKTDFGTKALGLNQIASITFKDNPKTAGAQEEFRNYLRVQVPAAQTARPEPRRIGMTYLQKGIRWMPSYRIELDGKGQASAKLQATVVNEMMDLTNVTLNLVIGVPSFTFKDNIDPMAVQETLAQLSQFFQGRNDVTSNLRNNFNNSIMSQQYLGGAPSASQSTGTGVPSDLPEGAKNEDLFVFTLHNITLRKGERLQLPLSSSTAKYQDIYTLDVPFTPPPELGRNSGTRQQMELARMMTSPKVMHKARLSNNGKEPFTTAPALILREGKIVAQGMMTYAAPGASADLSLTTAIDIQVNKTDAETNRIPNAVNLDGNNYMQVNCKGGLRLVNRRGETVEIEVNRYVLGQADRANSNGKIEMVNMFEDSRFLSGTGGEDSTDWWNSYSWPYWWSRANGSGRITWNFKLDAGQSIDLGYAWHYFWR